MAALFLVSIPWYRAPSAAPALVLGVPDWVLVALACYVAIAILNTVAWLGADLDDGEEPGRGAAP